MHPKLIIAHLYQRNSSVKQVAQKVGVTGSIVSRVIHDSVHSRKVATYISGFIKIPLDELWPGVYIKQYDHKMRAAS